MDLLDLRAHIITALKAQLPVPALAKVKVEPHPGRFELDQIARYAVGAPCIRVAVLSGSDKDMSDDVVGVELAAYVLTTSGKAGLPDSQNLKLASLLLPIIRASGVLDTDSAGSPQTVIYRNLYNASLGDEGIALGVITWRQTLPLPAIDPATPLGSFETLFAEFDLGPAPDGTAEATNSILLEGA